MSKISKIGVGIVAFEGTEHIKNITYEIREYVDEIVVCLQKVSYHNKPIEQEDVDEVMSLVKVGLVDKVIWFEADLSYLNNKDKIPHKEYRDIPRRIETNKRNYILDVLEADGCSHSMVIDSDEFYDWADFARATRLINDRDDIHVTYAQYINYYKDYRHYMLYPFQCFVPFIAEAKYRFEFRCNQFVKSIDPTRVYKLNNDEMYHIISWNVVKMHHFSWIRKDIRKKLDNWSSQDYFEKKKYERVFERFDNYQDWQNARVMFAIPKNEMCINKLVREYIHPHYKLTDKVV